MRARSVELKSAGWAGVLAGISIPAGSTVPTRTFVVSYQTSEQKPTGGLPPAIQLHLTAEPLGQPEQPSQRLSAQPNTNRRSAVGARPVANYIVPQVFRGRRRLYTTGALPARGHGPDKWSAPRRQNAANSKLGARLGAG